VGFGQKKKWKNKEKRFEPVVKQSVTDYAGKYDGIDDEHFIEVRMDAAGRWLITSREGKRQSVLRDIRVDAARLTAIRIYADGSAEKFEGHFVNRILNGETVFGLLVEGPVKVDESLTIERVFYRRR
jgi:hypothetical protein